MFRHALLASIALVALRTPVPRSTLRGPSCSPGRPAIVVPSGSDRWSSSARSGDVHVLTPAATPRLPQVEP
jgi:hypothetical protein